MSTPRPAAPASLLRYTSLRALLEDRFGTRMAGRITDANRYELSQLLLDALGFVGHVGSVSFEVGWDQCYAELASLIGPMIRHANARGVVVRGYQPAVVELLAKLTALPVASATVIAEDSRFATDADAQGQAVVFSADADVDVVDTRLIDARHLDDSTGTYVDVTTELRSLAGSVALVLPAVPALDDLLEISFPQGQLTDEITVDVSVAAAGVTFTWCYWNGREDQLRPYEVQDMGGGQLRLRFELPDGWGSPLSLYVRAALGLTGAYQDARTVAFGGGFAVELAAAPPTPGESDGYLGQSSPSLDPSDYELSMEWIPLPGVTDSTTGLTVLGANAVSWDLPSLQDPNLNLRWRVGQADDPDNARRSMAALVVTVPGPVTIPQLESVVPSGEGYVVFDATQGAEIKPLVLGTHGGTADEVFTFGSGDELFEGAVIQVDEGGGYADWLSVDHLLNSDDGDEHVIVRRSASDLGGWEAVFGDGVNGRIPAGASTVAVRYSTDGDLDGNVGANQVVVNADGVADVSTVTNPEAASGWQVADGADDESMEDLRDRILAAPRIKHAPITLGDHEQFAVDWTDDQGASPVARAFARMHTTDPKVIVMVVVGGGGALLPSGTLTSLGEYFNDAEDGVVLVNHRVDVSNYTPRVISFTLAVERDGSTWTGLDPQLASAIRRWANADSDEGDAKRFSPGGTVYNQKLLAYLEREFPILRGERYVMDLTLPASDTTLGASELPSPGTITINGVAY